MDTLAFRYADASDVVALLDFWERAGENGDRPIDSPDGIEVLMEKDPEALLIAVDGETIVGTVIAGWDGWRCSLYRLAVEPSRRHEGIARELVARAEDRFVELGGIRADAMVLEDNDSGTRAWMAFGYERQENWRRWVRPLAR